MRNVQDTFETRKRSFVSAFSICMTVPLKLVCECTSGIKGIVMQIEKALINGRLRVSKVF